MDIFGANNGGLKLATFDSSVLSNFYSSGVSLGQTLHAKKINEDILKAANNLDASVIPPWELPAVAPEDREEALQRIFSTGDLIDLNDPRIQGDGDNDNFKNLFALYTGLTRLRELVTFAETDAAATTYKDLLQSRMERYFEETKSFVGGLNFGTDANLLYGIRQTSMTSTLEFPKTESKVIPYHIGAVVSDVRDNAISGLAGTETFDITVTNSSGTTTVNIDLSAVSGTLNVDNIATHINDQMSAAGFVSSIKVKRHDEYAYGFEWSLNSAETLSFGNVGASEPAIYIAGKNNVGDSSSGFVKKLDSLTAASPTEVFRSEIDTTAADDARAVAVDSNGFVYTVGNTAGDMEGQANQASTDTYLRKLDAAGNLVWSRLLGAADQSAGFAVAVDGSDNVVVAGQVQGALTDAAYGGNYDSFVTKFNSSGVEQWTRQAAPYANDGALAVTADSSGNVFVAGYTQAAIDSSNTYAGGNDAFVTKLDSDGTLQWNTQFGDTGDDRATGVALDASGNVFVAAEHNGSAVVRKYTDGGSSATLAWEATAGSLNSGDTVAGLAVGSSGAVYLAGSTTNTAFNGTIAQAHAGGNDGYVTKITDNGGTATVDFTSYVGSAGTDSVAGIAVRANAGADEIYVTGATTGGIDGSTAALAQDYYAVKLDSAGSNAWTKQFRGSIAHSGNAVAFDVDGTDVLSRLGLPKGEVPIADPTELTGLTSVRAGQSFQIAVDGAVARTVTIESDDTLGFLAYKIKKILGQSGSVELKDGIDAKTMTIEAQNGGVIEIFAGPDGFDALPGLGLSAGTLHGPPADSEEEEAEDDTIFELGFVGEMDITDTTSATDVGVLIDNAIREIRDMFRFLSVGPEDERETGLQPVSAEDAEKLASMQAALSFVSSLAQQATATNTARLDGQTGANSSNLFNLVT